MSPGSSRIRSIHYLRAIAALMVVTYHAFSYHLASADNPASVLWLREGVGLFFGISGYVMVVSTAGSSPSSASFFARRIKRIAPLYWMATTCIILGTQEADWLKIFSSLLFLPSVEPPILPVGWTLNFEMAFYALFALSLQLARRIAIPALASVLVLASGVGGIPTAPPFAIYYGQPILLDFAAGMLIAHFGFRLPGWLMPVGFLLLAAIPQFTDIRPLTVTLPVAMILISAPSLEHKLKDWPLPLLLGEASYAIYLSHLFVVIAALSFLGHDQGFAFAVAIMGSVIAGVIVHLYVEKPLARALAQAGRGSRLEAQMA